MHVGICLTTQRIKALLRIVGIHCIPRHHALCRRRNIRRNLPLQSRVVGHRLADALDPAVSLLVEEVFPRCRREFLERAEFSSEILRGGRSDVRNAQSADETPKLRALAGLDRSKQIVGGLLDALTERQQVVPLQPIKVRDALQPALIDERVDHRPSHALDVDAPL